MSAESPYAGTVVPPAGAGTRTPLEGRRSEHRASDGMLNGGEVVITSSNAHSISKTRCRVLEFVSVPAAHLVVRTDTGRRRIIFCSAIEYIDQAS